MCVFSYFQHLSKNKKTAWSSTLIALLYKVLK